MLAERALVCYWLLGEEDCRLYAVYTAVAASAVRSTPTTRAASTHDASTNRCPRVCPLPVSSLKALSARVVYPSRALVATLLSPLFTLRASTSPPTRNHPTENYIPSVTTRMYHFLFLSSAILLSRARRLAYAVFTILDASTTRACCDFLGMENIFQYLEVIVKVF